MKLGFGWEMDMEHEVVLTRKDGSVRHFRIFGRSTPRIGDTVTLPIDGHLIKARIIQSADHIAADELEGF